MINKSINEISESLSKKNSKYEYLYKDLLGLGVSGSIVAAGFLNPIVGLLGIVYFIKQGYNDIKA